MAGIGWIRFDDNFVVFSDEKDLKEFKDDEIHGFIKKGLRLGRNNHNIAMAESSWEGKQGNILDMTLRTSKNLEEACYNYIKEFQKSGKCKVNLLVASNEKGVILELFRHKFSLAQNDWMIARTEHFEVFTDLNNKPEKSISRLDELNAELVRVKSPKDLKKFTIMKISSNR